MRLVQLQHVKGRRRIAFVSEPYLIFLETYSSMYELARSVLSSEVSFERLVTDSISDEKILYDEAYYARSEWRLLPSFDHPYDVQHCILSGTGLTHKASAENRQAMHKEGKGEPLTDSMKMYQMGIDGGKPPKGNIGVQPEWFYKGNGSLLRGHGEFLEVPAFGHDGGEEAEIAGVYIIDEKGKPWRIGFTVANEFSDHVMERKNYLYLAPSKIRTCSIGPELVVRSDFRSIQGRVSLSREGIEYWTNDIYSGADYMVHSLENLEYHHFKYDNHRISGQAHIHFLSLIHI